MADKKLQFPNGFSMPIFGLGTWQSTDRDKLDQAVCEALDAGYLLIDTAHSYDNERIIGDRLRARIEDGQLKREEIFVTTKLPGIYMGSRERVREGFQRSYEALQLDYIDLFLIHSPVGFKLKEERTMFPMGSDGRLEVEHADLVATWQTMEELVDEGKIYSLGVSNFNSEQIEQIMKVARHPICNQQVECQVYFQQVALREFCKARGITVTAFGSLGSPEYSTRKGLPSDQQPLQDPVVAQLAKKYSKTPAQVLLKFLLQEGIAIIPKSLTPSRIRENIQVFDFTMSPEDMSQLKLLGEKNMRMFKFESFAHSPDFPFSAAF